MRTEKELIDRLNFYSGAEYYYSDIGYIAWQITTGENVELLFIESKESGKGYGTQLVREMCKRIKPYNSVFVFRLASNENAGTFYRYLGFNETLIKGLYKVDAVLGVANYKKLCENLMI